MRLKEIYAHILQSKPKVLNTKQLMPLDATMIVAYITSFDIQM